MNTKDAEILVNAEDAVGLYASPLLSPIESSPTLLSKGKNSYKIQKKPKVPYYLREVRMKLILVSHCLRNVIDLLRM